jgi:hypothetical protein
VGPVAPVIVAANPCSLVEKPRAMAGDSDICFLEPEDRRPDGRVVLRPDLSVKAMLARHGERELVQVGFGIPH